MKFKFRTGDTVQAIAGNDKGQRGEVISVDRESGRAVVKGLNLRTRHRKPTQQNPKGERVQQEAPIHASNLMRVDPATGKPTRKRAVQESK